MPITTRDELPRQVAEIDGPAREGRDPQTGEIAVKAMPTSSPGAGLTKAVDAS